MRGSVLTSICQYTLPAATAPSEVVVVAHLARMSIDEQKDSDSGSVQGHLLLSLAMYKQADLAIVDIRFDLGLCHVHWPA